jgi:hypothetical protein
MYNYFDFDKTYRAPKAREITLSVRAQEKKMALLRAMYRHEATQAPKRTTHPLKALLAFLTGSKTQRQLAGASRK